MSSSDVEHAEATQARFAASVERMVEHEQSRRRSCAARCGAFEPAGDERVLDVGAGTGGFAFAVAPLVKESRVGVVPEVTAAVGRAQSRSSRM